MKSEILLGDNLGSSVQLSNTYLCNTSVKREFRKNRINYWFLR